MVFCDKRRITLDQSVTTTYRRTLLRKGSYAVPLTDFPHVTLGSSVMHLKRLALSYLKLKISTLFDICSFPCLTHLHLNVKTNMESILLALSTIQDTLLYYQSTEIASPQTRSLRALPRYLT